MNNLDSRQRKLVYIVSIIVLLIPIVLLGMPEGGDESGGGGLLARMRSEYDLGESDLGQIDPTSASMNLVLLGLRGIAVNLLRTDLDHYKSHKEWAQMRATTEAVITLQPHYIEVWRFLSWNLAFNVSAEWDAVSDRYYWVKEGGKFSQRGSRRNDEVPELYWETGRVWGAKVGRSDEWHVFRKYFISDPDERAFNGGPDPDINPEQIDNYLVAKKWYHDANRLEEMPGIEQHIMMRALFRSYPYRSQLDYADALQRDVRYIRNDDFMVDERTGERRSEAEALAMARQAREARFNASTPAWETGFEEWTQQFGKMYFRTPACIIQFEVNEDGLRAHAKEQNVSQDDYRDWLDRQQKTTNYLYWRSRAKSESESRTTDAHRLMYEGDQKYFLGEIEDAKKDLVKGMTLYAEVLDDYPNLKSDDLTIEEALWAALLWQKILELPPSEPVPANWPLKTMWDTHPGFVEQMQEKFDEKSMEEN